MNFQIPIHFMTFKPLLKPVLTYIFNTNIVKSTFGIVLVFQSLLNTFLHLCKLLIGMCIYCHLEA